MEAELAKKYRYAYLLDIGATQTIAFLCPYRVFAKLSEIYRMEPGRFMIMKDFYEMEQAVNKGESIEMIKGIFVRRVPLAIAY